MALNTRSAGFPPAATWPCRKWPPWKPSRASRKTPPQPRCLMCRPSTKSLWRSPGRCSALPSPCFLPSSSGASENPPTARTPPPPSAGWTRPDRLGRRACAPETPSWKSTGSRCAIFTARTGQRHLAGHHQHRHQHRHQIPPRWPRSLCDGCALPPDNPMV